MDTNHELLKAIVFAAEKHKLQRRKGNNSIPYINHPLQVTFLLSEAGETDIALLVAGILHDTLEDTDAKVEEILNLFGKEVLDLVEELTDDKSLPFQMRKDKQVEKAPHLSEKASKLKFADKICNLRDILNSPPEWTIERRIDYLNWSEKVVSKLKAVQPELNKIFYKEYNEGMKRLKMEQFNL